MWTLVCLVKSPDWEKLFPHTPHENGFSPVCTRVCRVRWAAWVKPFPHTSQLNGLSVVCTWSWRSSGVEVVVVVVCVPFMHMTHGEGLSAMLSIVETSGRSKSCHSSCTCVASPQNDGLLRDVLFGVFRCNSPHMCRYCPYRTAWTRWLKPQVVFGTLHQNQSNKHKQLFYTFSEKQPFQACHILNISNILIMSTVITWDSRKWPYLK